MAAEIARKKAVVGMAAVVLNPIGPDAREDGHLTDRSDDTALLIQTLGRVKEHFRGLEKAGIALSNEGSMTYAMVCESLDLVRQRMEEQG